eukprot:scaffold53036_cov63-Phaeocystis_antarctica.AAC.5
MGRGKVPDRSLATPPDEAVFLGMEGDVLGWKGARDGPRWAGWGGVGHSHGRGVGAPARPFC